MLTIDARLELFKKQFPKEKIKSVQERQGSDHSVLEINHTWMCKSSKTAEGIALLDREVQLLTMLQGKITTAIPVPVHYEENFLVYKKITGSPLIPYAFYRLGNKQRSKLILEIAQFLAQLHTILSPAELASLNLAKPDMPWSLEKLQAHRHHVAENKELAEVFDSIMNIYEEELAIPVEPTLIHNNMAIKNVIIDPLTGQLRGIIDFTHVALGDYYLDLRMRRENPIEYTKAVAFVYAMVRSKEQNGQKLYAYYFAAEFSRYFQYLEAGDEKSAKETLSEIIKSIRQFLTSHDDCKDGDEACGHSQPEGEIAA